MSSWHNPKLKSRKWKENKKAQDKTVKKLETRLQSAPSSVHCLCQRIYRSRHKNEDGVDSMSQENSGLHAQLDDIEEAFSSKVAELEERIELLITEVELARHERDILSVRLDDLQSNTIRTKNGQRFVDGVRQCCVELLAMNVATTQVEPVIRSVLLNIAGIEVAKIKYSL